MKGTLENEFPGIEVELIQSKGGAFEVRHDGRMVFSKLETDRFPEHDEIVEKLRAR